MLTTEENRPLKVAVVTELPPTATNGIITTLGNTVDLLRESGEEVLILSPNAPDLPESYHGSPVIGSPSIRNPLYPDMTMGFPILGRKARKALRKFAPDVVHVFNPFTYGVGGVRYARRHGLPLVESYMTHLAPYTRNYHLGMLEGPMWRWMRHIHNKADLNLAVSQQVYDELERRGFKNLELWKPGVNTELFNPEKKDESFRDTLTDGHPERTIIISVGRLAREKRLEMLIPVMKGLQEKGKDVHLAIVGQGEDRERLEKLCEGLPVTFTGVLHGEELARAYASSDIFVTPSTTETVGLVVLEAMASGLPVVAANAAGIPEFVTDGQEGYLVEPDNSNAFVGAIVSLVDNSSLRQQLGASGVASMRELSWKKATDTLKGDYDALIVAKRKRRWSR